MISQRAQDSFQLLPPTRYLSDNSPDRRTVSRPLLRADYVLTEPRSPMPRKRTGTVRESKEYLDALADQFGDEPIGPRIEMLRLLKSDPTITAPELAYEISVTDRTVGRWWSTYRTGGLRELLASDVNTLDGPMPVRVNTRGGRPTFASGDVSTRFTRFLNAIPMSYDVDEWVLTFRDALLRVLDGVDHVTVNVDVGSDLDGDEAHDMEVVVMKGATRSDIRAARNERAYAATVRGRSPGKVLYEQARAHGFPVEKYYRPAIFDFYTDGTEFVGTILLWSRRGQPIPRATIEFMESLRGFITYVMNDCVVRQQLKEPELLHFKDVLLSIAYRIGLTAREQEIFFLQMAGVDRDEIAARLGIAPKTAKNHISAIYAKAGTNSYSDLLGRFMVPLRDD